MTQRILLILGHPSSTSFCSAIASKNCELAGQIAGLQKMQAGLMAFEAQLKDAQGQCSGMR